jgi:hypothetical protein
MADRESRYAEQLGQEKMPGSWHFPWGVGERKLRDSPVENCNFSTAQTPPSEPSAAADRLQEPATPPEPGPEGESVSDDETRFIKGFRLVCLMIGLMLAVFLISIDRTIISTVSPDPQHFSCIELLTDEFQRPFPTSRTNSSQPPTSGGMDRHICLRRAPFSRCLARSS